MARIAGIKLNKSLNGKIKTVTFDFKKHGDIINPILEKLGAVEPQEEEDDFEREFKAGLTGAEIRKFTHDYIDSLPWKK